jgi:hypothetical protein
MKLAMCSCWACKRFRHHWRSMIKSKKRAARHKVKAALRNGADEAVLPTRVKIGYTD